MILCFINYSTLTTDQRIQATLMQNHFENVHTMREEEATWSGRLIFIFSLLSPPQRPLCIVGRHLCCGEAGEKEKESARVPCALSIFSIIDILMGIPSGSLCGGESFHYKFYMLKSLILKLFMDN